MPEKQKIIGDVINNAYARARRAFEARDLEGYQKLARIQTDLGCVGIDVNIDGTQSLQVRQPEMLEFLPELIPALQEATDVSLCLDNPSLKYHETGLQHYDTSKGRPIMNSIAASRENLEGFFDLIKQYDVMPIVMASEKFLDNGDSAQCMSGEDVYRSAKHFVALLRDKAGRANDQIIIDPGLAPVGADTYGLTNMGLDAMEMIRKDPDLEGVHMSVGLTNFAWGTPKNLRHQLERAYLCIAGEKGLDWALANVEKEPVPLDPNDPMVVKLRETLDAGRVQEGETQEMAGFRQAEKVLDLMSMV